jgi:hypothetical protein
MHKPGNQLKKKKQQLVQLKLVTTMYLSIMQ